MPEMQDDCEASYRPDLLSLVQHPDAQIVVLKRSIHEFLIASVDVHEQASIQAEITAPNAVVINAIAVHEPPEKRVLYLDRFFNFARIAGQGIQNEAHREAVQYHAFLEQLFSQLSSEFDPLAAKNGGRVAVLNMRPDKVPVGHAVAIDKDKVVSSRLPDRRIQDPRLPETNILLPDMLDEKNIMKRPLHFVYNIPCLGRAPVIGDQDL
jgi:hypothetical protein